MPNRAASGCYSICIAHVDGSEDRPHVREAMQVWANALVHALDCSPLGVTRQRDEATGDVHYLIAEQCLWPQIFLADAWEERAFLAYCKEHLCDLKTAMMALCPESDFHIALYAHALRYTTSPAAAVSWHGELVGEERHGIAW